MVGDTELCSWARHLNLIVPLSSVFIFDIVCPQYFDHCDDAYSLSIRVQTTLKMKPRILLDHSCRSLSPVSVA